MKSIQILIFFVFSTTAWLQETRLISLHVDVLGKKHETVRYYHPIEGNYTVTLNNYVNDKKIAGLFSNCVFIDPRIQLKDSLTHIQANSLRHYCDPSELIYIDWQWDSDTSNVQDLARFKINSERIREKKYQNQINDYFTPFYFRIGEVSNKEYREFVYWVRDSLFKEKIYFSNAFSDEEVFTLLNANPKSVYYKEENQEWRSIDVHNREENRRYFSFKPGFELEKCFTDERVHPEIIEFYLHSNERWYRGREIDVTKLKYSYTKPDVAAMNAALDTLTWRTVNGKVKRDHIRTQYLNVFEISVYPDTLGWVRDSRYFFNDPFSNMYFWHPAYDNYPVVGVSWEQAKAFCHWKEQQLIAQHPQLNGKIEVDLPRIYEYENAIFDSKDYSDQLILNDTKMITDLLLDNSEGKYGAFHELLQKNIIPFTNPVYFTVNRTNNASVRWFLKKFKHYYPQAFDPEYEHQDLIYNFMLMRASQNFLESNIRYLSNNVSEWMCEDYETHYEELFKAYINYHCFASIDYCEHQRIIDQNFNNKNPEEGKLIMGSNWFDERYEIIFGVNIAGLYAKRFEHAAKSHSTVGFRYVVRLK